MIYSCSWPDYERSSSVAVNFSLVAEYCNSWRIFWDVREYEFVPLLRAVGWTHIKVGTMRRGGAVRPHPGAAVRLRQWCDGVLGVRVHHGGPTVLA